MQTVIDVLKIGVLLGFIVILVTYTSTPKAAATGGFVDNYIWSDSLDDVSTTAIDSFYTTRWEQCSIKSVGGPMYVKVGAPDTAGWTSRDWYYIDKGEVVVFGSATRLKRLSVKAVSGTVDFYQIGYKTSKQH